MHKGISRCDIASARRAACKAIVYAKQSRRRDAELHRIARNSLPPHSDPRFFSALPFSPEASKVPLTHLLWDALARYE